LIVSYRSKIGNIGGKRDMGKIKVIDDFYMPYTLISIPLYRDLQNRVECHSDRREESVSPSYYEK